MRPSWKHGAPIIQFLSSQCLPHYQFTSCCTRSKYSGMMRWIQTVNLRWGENVPQLWLSEFILFFKPIVAPKIGTFQAQHRSHPTKSGCWGNALLAQVLLSPRFMWKQTCHECLTIAMPTVTCNILSTVCMCTQHPLSLWMFSRYMLHGFVTHTVDSVLVVFDPFNFVVIFPSWHSCYIWFDQSIINY